MRNFELCSYTLSFLSLSFFSLSRFPLFLFSFLSLSFLSLFSLCVLLFVFFFFLFALMPWPRFQSTLKPIFRLAWLPDASGCLGQRCLGQQLLPAFKALSSPFFGRAWVPDAAACLLVCLLVCLLAGLLACLLACLLVCLFACLLVLLACLLACGWQPTHNRSMSLTDFFGGGGTKNRRNMRLRVVPFLRLFGCLCACFWCRFLRYGKKRRLQGAVFVWRV